MRITDVRLTIVSVPFTQPEAWRFGRAWGLTNVIVEVETDVGVTGIGEAPGNPAVRVIAEAIRSMAELIIGDDARHPVRILRKLRQRGWHHYQYLGNTASAALEMALWDIVGKARAVPLHELFGSFEREIVPFYWYLPIPNRQPEQAAAEAEAGIERGFHTMYLKVGFDVANDISLIRSLREFVGPDVAIRIDANEGWSLHEALHVMVALEDCALEFCEQPIDMHNLSELALLRKRTRTPIGANQSAWLDHNVLDIVRLGAADVIVTDPHQAGGLSTFRDVAAICETANLPVVKHSFGDLGVTTAASLHVLAGLPEPALGHQTHLELLESDLLAEPFGFEEGGLRVPAGPGLGVELDRGALARYAALYEEIGELSGYAAPDSPSPIAATGARAV